MKEESKRCRMKWGRMKEEGEKGADDERIKRKAGRGGRGAVKSPRLFSTFSIMTLAWIHTQLLNDKYPGEPIRFVFFGWRAAAVVRAEE